MQTPFHCPCGETKRVALVKSREFTRSASGKQTKKTAYYVGCLACGAMGQPGATEAEAKSYWTNGMLNRKYARG